MIKFRKGNLITQAMPALPETVLAPAVATPMAPAASSKKWQSDQINLEWWQTPLKYKRRDVDILEVDSINVSLMNGIILKDFLLKFVFLICNNHIFRGHTLITLAHKGTYLVHKMLTTVL